MFFILCCRDEVPELRHSRLYKSVDLLREKAAIVNGMIADDEMPQAVQSFLGYILTDVGVYRALSALQLGEQFAAVLEKGCDAITLTEVTVPVNEQSSLVAFDKARMRKSNELYASIFKTFKSIGRCLDDLLQEGIVDVSIDKLPDSWEEIVRRYKR